MEHVYVVRRYHAPIVRQVALPLRLSRWVACTASLLASPRTRPTIRTVRPICTARTTRGVGRADRHGPPNVIVMTRALPKVQLLREPYLAPARPVVRRWSG